MGTIPIHLLHPIFWTECVPPTHGNLLVEVLTAKKMGLEVEPSEGKDIR